MTQATVETHQLPLRLPREDYEALRNLAHFSNQSMNSIVVRVLQAFFANEGRDEQFEAMQKFAQEHYGPLLDKLART